MSASDDTVLPEKLDFKCTDRELVRSQLRVLRQTDRNKSSETVTSGAGNEGNAKKRVKTERHEEGGSSKAEPSTAEEAERAGTRADVIRGMKAHGVGQNYFAPTGEFALKWALAGPYHLFFTAVQACRPTWDQSLSVTMSEILDRSLGAIARSAHTTMVLDIGWLLAQYMLACQDRKAKISLFYHDKVNEVADCSLPANIEANVIRCPTSWGTHHCKISMLQYTDGGARIVVSSANLYQDDWDLRTQGVWVSPHLPRMEDARGADEGESPTGFKRDFLRLLERYGEPMAEWKEVISRVDCSSINVVFVASAPGEYADGDMAWGYRKLGSILREHAVVPENEAGTTVVAQVSSIGSLGSNYGSWLGKEIIAAMSETRDRKGKAPTFKLVYPTIDNYRISYDMREAANCLCNSQQKRQEWILPYMHKWRSNGLVRTKAIPHIKTFTRLSEDKEKLWWFVLGSANLSKAAWGQVYRGKFRILSYEAGVVFLPKFVNGEADFSIREDPSRSVPKFPMPYDLPLVPYTETDRPFTEEFFRNDFTG